MDDTSSPAAPTTASEQARVSLIGQATGFGCSIGAVYLAERGCPRQTQAMIGRLAEKLGAWRGTGATAEQQLAKKVADIGIMYAGGLMNVATQFGIRRHQQQEETQTPFGYELGRVATGWLSGSATAIGTLALTETVAPRLVNRPGRFASLFMSNVVQSVGGLAGNIPSQLLYDAVVGTPKARIPD